MTDSTNSSDVSTDVPENNPDLLKRLHQILDASAAMARIDSADEIVKALADYSSALVDGRRTAIFLLDEQENHLTLQRVSGRPGVNINDLQQDVRSYPLQKEPDPVLSQWIKGEIYEVNYSSSIRSPVRNMLRQIGFDAFWSVPLLASSGDFLGVTVVDLTNDQPLSSIDKQILKSFTRSTQVMLQSARLHTSTVQKLADKMHEMSMLQQLDQELNETIDLPVVFTMMLDWALRFTNANLASIATYDTAKDELITAKNYGYAISDLAIEKRRSRSNNTLAHQVARAASTQVVSDVTENPDYTSVDEGVCSQMAVPVMREDRVVAVILLESYKREAFNEDHVNFVQQLANRAAVAVDNARLYDETVSEREKLSHILGSVGDVVIVIGVDGEILLISNSALSALQLQLDATYIGRFFEALTGFEPLIGLYNRVKTADEAADEELVLPNGRTYYVGIRPHTGIGWIIVMQDITLFKEMDRVKSELIATVSHDLKQPLGVMRGFLDLLQMQNDFNEKSMSFVNMIDNAISNMRQLIDDLLDLARIESGVDLTFEVLHSSSLLIDTVTGNRPTAHNKNITLSSHLPEDLPRILGDRPRLHQIFNNLIGNAIKYTPHGGEVKVEAENRGATLRVAIQDTGIGISPEDQPHVFDRFYRVRSQETENIDGTGLGLAIVKSLVEAHGGKIRLESQLGQGSTFFVTLPVHN